MVKAVLLQSCWASQFNTVLLLVFGKDGVVVVLGVGGEGTGGKRRENEGKKKIDASRNPQLVCTVLFP